MQSNAETPDDDQHPTQETTEERDRKRKRDADVEGEPGVQGNEEHPAKRRRTEVAKLGMVVEQGWVDKVAQVQELATSDITAAWALLSGYAGFVSGSRDTEGINAHFLAWAMAAIEADNPATVDALTVELVTDLGPVEGQAVVTAVLEKLDTFDSELAARWAAGWQVLAGYEDEALHRAPAGVENAIHRAQPPLAYVTYLRNLAQGDPAAVATHLWTQDADAPQFDTAGKAKLLAGVAPQDAAAVLMVAAQKNYAYDVGLILIAMGAESAHKVMIQSKIMAHLATNPQVAGQIVHYISSSSSMNNAVEQAAGLLTDMDPQSAAAVLASAPGDDFYQIGLILIAMAPEAASKTMTHLAATNPETAADIVGTLGMYGSVIVTNLAAALAGMDPPDAAAILIDTIRKGYSVSVGSLLVNLTTNTTDTASAILTNMAATNLHHTSAIVGYMGYYTWARPHAATLLASIDPQTAGDILAATAKTEYAEAVPQLLATMAPEKAAATQDTHPTLN